MAALNGTFALPQEDNMAVRIAENLNFDMPRVLDKLFEENAVIAESVLRFRPASRVSLACLLVVPGHAETLAPAARRGLEHDRVADFVCEAHGLFRCFRQWPLIVARNGVDVRLAGQSFTGNFVSHGGNGVRRRSNEDEPFLLQSGGEFLYFRERKPYPGCNASGSGQTAGVNHAVHRQVRFARRRRSNAHCLIGQGDMASILVGLGIDRDRLDAHAASRLQDAAGDLTAVGNQDFLEHEQSNP